VERIWLENSYHLATIDNDQGKLYEGAATLTQDGSFSGSFPVGTDAQVGNYNITVRQAAGDDNSLGAVPFRVADYVKPQFQVTTQVTPATAVVGDPVKFSLDAAYYSGGNVSNAQVQWFMQSSPTDYYPVDAYNQYSFSDYDYSNYYAYNNLGIVLAQMPGRLAEAIAHYEAALRIRPGYAEAHNNLGMALAQSPGRLADALAHCEEAVRLKPAFAEAHNNLAVVYAKTGRWEAAVSQVEIAARLDPASPAIRDNLEKLTARNRPDFGRPIP